MLVHNPSDIKKGVLIGLFIFLGGLAITLSFLFAESKTSLFQSGLKIKVKSDQASGIQVGTLVTLNGVKVGSVTDLNISEEDIRTVELTLELDKKLKNRIPKDSRVEVKNQGALGDRYLEITPGQSQEMLKEGEHLSASSFKDWIDSLREKSEKVDDLFALLKEGHLFVNSLNENNRIPSLIHETHLTMKNLNQTISDLKELLASMQKTERQQLQKSLALLEDILTKINRGQGTLGALINDPSLHNKLKDYLGADSKRELEALFQKHQLFQKNIPKN